MEKKTCKVCYESIIEGDVFHKCICEKCLSVAIDLLFNLIEGKKLNNEEI